MTDPIAAAPVRPARGPRLRRRLRAGAAGLAALGILAGCAPGQTGPSERQMGAAAVGAVVGTAAGLALGGGSRAGNALVGAGIGLLAGAAVGTFLDRQERELREDLAGTGAEVTRVDDALLVTLPGGVTFDFGSDVVKQEFRRPLTRVANTLNKYESSFVDVIGHTDNIGSDAFNQGLSERRAQAVARVLVNRGVKRQRLDVIGRGASDPVATNATPEGRAQNRRVEILIVPATQS